MTDTQSSPDRATERAPRAKHTVVVPNSIDMVSVLGPGDEHLRLLERAFEAEERYNDWHARHSGLRNAAEIDFGALREEIACRLQTLRDCCEGEG